MDSQRVDMFLMSNSKYFESQHLPVIREKLMQMTDDNWHQLQMVQYKDPTVSIIVSLLAGGLGIDRFIIGDVGLGIGKLLTLGGLGIWTIIDWFLIMGATREKNLEQLRKVIG